METGVIPIFPRITHRQAVKNTPANGKFTGVWLKSAYFSGKLQRLHKVDRKTAKIAVVQRISDCPPAGRPP